MRKVFLSAAWRQKCLDAMRRTLDVHAELKNEMIAFLRDEEVWDPSAQWTSSVNRFNACLRPGDEQCFSNVALWALIKRFDRLDWFLAMADDLGFEVRKKPSDERRIELLERLTKAIEANNLLIGSSAQDLAALEPPPGKGDGSVAHGGKVNFDVGPDAVIGVFTSKTPNI